LTVLPLRYAPDPVLRTKTARIRDIDSRMQKLIDDMIETMHANQGVGLAACQVGVPWRLAVIQLPEEEFVHVLINPDIVRRENEREVEEGCLSIPGYRGSLKRSERVKVRALDRNGKVVRIKADGLLAQALEHETDHLDGTLYTDRLASSDDLFKIEPQDIEEANDMLADDLDQRREANNDIDG
jgi:peptide deformylase